jgi:glycosyltransferase involved in cell wall biosynthesis
MRILHVIRSVNRVNGGPAEGVRQLMAATFALGQFPEVLTLDAPQDEWVKSFPGSIHAIGPVATNYGYTGRLDRWLRLNARHYDALVVHGLWQFHGLAVWRALRGGPLPYFLYPHGMLDPWFRHAYPAKHLKKSLYWRLIESRVVNDAAAVLFTASEEARLAAQTFSGYRARPAVIGYGIVVGDTARLGSAESFTQAWPETRGKRNVLFLGRLHPKKGGDLLIEAFAQVAPADASLHLVMAGPRRRRGHAGGVAGAGRTSRHCRADHLDRHARRRCEVVGDPGRRGVRAAFAPGELRHRGGRGARARRAGADLGQGEHLARDRR